MPPALPPNFGTLAMLKLRTGIAIRTLYRYRDKGVFKESLRYGTRQIYYDLPRCQRAIQTYAKSGRIKWPIL